MRQRLGPRLFLRTGNDRKPTWFIRDHLAMYSTGLPEDRKGDAEKALELYAATLGVPAYHGPIDTKVRGLGYIYYVTCDHEDFPIKIGFATDVCSRMAQLQGMLPYRLIVLATRPGLLVDEWSAHVGFSEYRLQGEWFRRSPELMAHIEKIKAVDDIQKRTKL